MKQYLYGVKLVCGISFTPCPKGVIILEDNKIIKVFKYFNYRCNNKGMALLEFIIIMVAIFSVMALSFQIGAILKNEAILAGATNSLAKSTAVKGMLDSDDVGSTAAKLAGVGIDNFQVAVDVQNYNDSGYSSCGINDQIQLREKFRLRVTATYPINVLDSSLMPSPVPLNVPLKFMATGKSERFWPLQP